ncbi:TrkH family potassium uptake protein [Stutzerimonas zhaodongensis]|uniref:TrkH family potassium uptake protein n=1 Tax=Stutzerimonas zhaodongensis TaxID=1176257 RepID=UPI002107BEF3|nr:potassium transporter TrkG [Stutzerimonas zhaodongensis]MCQ2029481.1 TrkH family potassium uptake protein [Stutzerimonas zhaodongensis]
MKSSLHPARVVALIFAGVILLGTALLMLPAASSNGLSAPLVTALFTAVSAVCVTGLVVVDTGTYWTALGQVVILALFQLGGFGMMTVATLMGLLVNRSFRLRTKMIAQVESRSLGVGDVTSVAKLVLVVTLVVEAAVALLLTLRFHLTYDVDWPGAAWSGLFRAVSAFNNAGFSIHADSLMGFATDGFVLTPVMIAIIIGGIGFPVLQDLRTRFTDSRHWSLHTKLTLSGTAILLLGGFVSFVFFEWANPRTLGPMALMDKLLSAIFMSVSARTAGFNALDIGALTHESWALHYLLMFIGGGSAGTAGGVKIGTMAILVLMVVAEVRGRPDCEVFGRRITTASQRQAITVMVLGSAMVVLGTLVILRETDFPTDQVIFEVISAFGTVGLSTGITAALPESSQLMLSLLMYTGRVGTITLAVSLALGAHRMPYRYPEEHPIVG